MRQNPSAVRLHAVQRAWLQELGVEAALLRRYAAPVTPAVSSAPQRMPPQRVDPPVSRPVTPPAARAGLKEHADAAIAAEPKPNPQPSRAVNLMCQRYVPRDVAGIAGQEQVWVVLGEVPGATLAQNRATQLLHAMLAAVRLQPVDPFVRLVPDLPQAQENGFQIQLTQFQNQLRVWQPTCILALGRVAASTLLRTTESLESLRGKVWSCADADGTAVPVVVTYPPGWLLANPRHKAEVWRDLLMARAAACSVQRGA